MATPRKHWLRLYESLLDEGWDDAVVATIVRLMCWLNRRWARNGIPHQEAGDAFIPMLEVMALTRRKRADRARVVLESCARAVTMTTRWRAEGVEISWPKFPILQEYGSRSPGSDRDVTTQSRPSPTPTPDSSSLKTEKKTEPASPPRSPLLNLLTRLPGDEAEKTAWLEETGPQIEVDAQASRERDAKPRTVAQLTVAYYRRYLENCRREGLSPRPFVQLAKDARELAAIRAARAKRKAAGTYESGPPPPSDSADLFDFESVMPTAPGGTAS